jgi:hypothetical protein
MGSSGYVCPSVYSGRRVIVVMLRGTRGERRERAARNRERGEELLARRYEHAAERQAGSARAAEEIRLGDVAVEGEQLGEPEPARKRERRAPDR